MEKPEDRKPVECQSTVLCDRLGNPIGAPSTVEHQDYLVLASKAATGVSS